MTAATKLDEALKLLDEIDSTPLSQLNEKLDRIVDAVVGAKYALTIERVSRARLAHRFATICRAPRTRCGPPCVTP